MSDYMKRAIALGEQGRITAPPNPWVGCVIVKEGRIIGEGYHHKAGEAHAEIIALRQTATDPVGATIYTTLEPCCHTGRTPPCVHALIAAKVAHVVVAVQDPDPKVSGKGIEALKAAGIKVTTRVSEELASESLQPYLHHRKTGLPYCVAKAAISLDGRTAAKDGSSQWITCEEARKDAHQLRAESQAIMVGSGTARQDKPRLNVRGIDPAPSPLRVIVNSRGDLPSEGPLFDPALGKTLLFSTQNAKRTDCEVIQVAKKESGVDLEEVLKTLGKRGVLQLMVEGGATLLGSLLKASLIDELVLYMGPCILGDEGTPLFQGTDVSNITEAPRLKIIDTISLSKCVKIRYKIK